MKVLEIAKKRLKMTTPHIGSALDDLLKDESILENAEAIAIKRIIAFELQEKMKRDKIKKTAITDSAKYSNNINLDKKSS